MKNEKLLLLSLVLVSTPTWRQVQSQSTGDCLFADETGQVFIEESCICDPSCELCGYYGEAVSGPDDCLTCPDGFVLNILFDDGSGTCTEQGVGTLDPTPDGGDLFPTSPPNNGTIDSGSIPGGICFMVYQMADNDLEEFIRQDLSEMTQSAFVASASTTTWVYFDALNQGSDYFTGGTLADVYNSDGTPLTERFDGSYYLKWDLSLGKMVVDAISSAELNSDSPLVLQGFIEYALTDCVAKEKAEYVLVLSSHGGGYAGFGFDDHESRYKRKLSYQSNAEISSAIQAALLAVPGAPSQLDVLGFDACLMQAMDALDDFAGSAKYYLASEAIEPGHGWAYNEFAATTSSMELGVNIVDTYVASLQGYSSHQTPKTLALVDTTAFLAFRDAWDALCAAMATLLMNGTDADFHAYLNRARGNTESFSGSLDFTSPQVNAAMDIGDFFVQFIQLCAPDESSELYILMNEASQAYDAMFVTTQVGPGTTTSATGMHITWVSKQEFLNDQEYYESVLVGSGTGIIMNVPNYWSFLSAFYFTPTPIENVGASVCRSSASASQSAASPDELLIDPSLVFVDATTSEIRSEIARSVDFVFVQYGIDLTNSLEDENFRRRLDESARRQEARQLANSAEERGSPSPNRPRGSKKWRYRDATNRRKLQQDVESAAEDYFWLYGGDIFVRYESSNVVASWDSTFFWIESGDDLEPAYAYDDGAGLKSIPVCYFDEFHPVTSEQIAIGITVDDAIAGLGCQIGFLSFSVAEESNGLLSLYVYKGNILSEEPFNSGRNIVPISFIEYSVGGVYVDELLGGFRSVVIPWTVESAVTVYVLSDAENLEIFQSDIAFLEILAYDEDAGIQDSEIFPYFFDSTGDSTGGSTGDSTGGSTTDDPATESSSSPEKKLRLPEVVGTCITALVGTFVFGWPFL